MNAQNKITCTDCLGDKPSTNWQKLTLADPNQEAPISAERHTYYQCESCGDTWIRIQGFGGSSGGTSFFHPQTSKFYKA